MQAGELEQKARAAARRWARWRLGPASFSDLITRVDVETLRYGRLITRYAVRSGTWVEEPFTGGRSAGHRVMSLERLDLWSGSPEELAERTSHPADCRECAGRGQVTCPSCSGSLRMRCSGCGGDGRRMSRARKSYRQVTCSDCRGNGTKKCTRCSRGAVGCTPCRGSGRMRRWVRVTTTERTQVGVWPADPRLHAHPGLTQGSPKALQWQGARTLEAREHDGELPAARVGPEAEAAGFLAMRSTLEPSLEPLRGRVLAQSLEVFEAPSATVHYEFAGHPGFLKLLGSDCRPTPALDNRPFNYRFAWLLAVFLLAFYGAVLLTNGFAERHDFYRRHDAAGLVALASLGLVPGCWLLTASWLRRRRADGTKSPKRWHDRPGAGLVGLCALTILGCFLFVRPSSEALARLTAAGHLDPAELHARALQAEGDTSPGFVEARNAFVRARIQGLGNREAVSLITDYTRTKVGTEPLEAERQRLRETWVLSALSQGQEDAAEQELAALADEGAPAPLVEELRARLENQRLAKGKALLAKGDADEAIRTLRSIRAPALTSEPPGPVLSNAYLLRARGCGARELDCRARAFKHAAEADPGTAGVELASFRTAEVGRLQKTARGPGALGPTLRALRDAEAEAGVLLAVLEGDSELTGARDALLRRREELLRNRHPLGEPVEVAQLLLGAEGLAERSPGVWTVREAPSGTLVHLFVSQGVTRGLHVTATAHRTEALGTEALQQVALRLTGQTFAAKDLSRTGKTGVAHVPARLGPHSALLGWQDGTLVEALIGKVEP
jgi:hypothetical protein